MKLKSLYSVLAAAGLVAMSGAALATNGYFAHGYGEKAKGMGGAGIAFGQDALAAATNPANMVLVGDRLDVGLELFNPQREVSLNTTEYQSSSNYFLIPEFGYNKMLSNAMSLGVAVYGNGGMNTDYSAISQFNGSGKRTGVDLAQLFISPTMAFKVSENHSIGVALNLAYQRFKMSGISNFAGYSQDSTKLTDNGYSNSYGWGARLGWTGKITPDITVGATYQTRTWMSRFNKYRGLFAQNGDFDIPENYGVGIAFKTTPSLTTAFDVVRINYGSVKSIANNISTLGVNNLGTENGPGFGWHDQTVYKLGFSYEYSKDLTLRAGWNHGDVPFPNTETAFNILAPAVVTDHLTLGGTWSMGGGSELTVSYMHAFGNNVNSVTTSGQTGTINDLRMRQNSLGVQYGMKF